MNNSANYTTDVDPMLSPLLSQIYNPAIKRQLSIWINIRGGMPIKTMYAIKQEIHQVMTEEVEPQHATVVYNFVDNQANWQQNDTQVPSGIDNIMHYQWKRLLNAARIDLAPSGLRSGYVADRALDNDIIIVATSSSVSPSDFMERPTEFQGIACGNMQDNGQLGYVSALFSRQGKEHVIQGTGTVLLEAMKAIMYRAGAKKIALGALAGVVGYYQGQGWNVDGNQYGHETPMSRHSQFANLRDDYKPKHYINRENKVDRCRDITEPEVCMNSYEQRDADAIPDACVLAGSGRDAYCDSIKTVLTKNPRMSVNTLHNYLKGKPTVTEEGELPIDQIMEDQILNTLEEGEIPMSDGETLWDLKRKSRDSDGYSSDGYSSDGYLYSDGASSSRPKRVRRY